MKRDYPLYGFAVPISKKYTTDNPRLNFNTNKKLPTCKCDSSNEGTEEERGLDHGGSGVGGEGWVMVNIGWEAGQHSSHTNLEYKLSTR